MKPKGFCITLRVSGFALLAILVFLILRGPVTPDGRYNDTKVAASGDVYWEFHDGKVALVINDRRDESFGNYAKVGIDWIWTNTHGKGPPSVSKLHTTWWSLRAGAPGASLTCYRRFYAPSSEE